MASFLNSLHSLWKTSASTLLRMMSWFLSNEPNWIKDLQTHLCVGRKEQSPIGSDFKIFLGLLWGTLETSQAAISWVQPYRSKCWSTTHYQIGSCPETWFSKIFLFFPPALVFQGLPLTHTRSEEEKKIWLKPDLSLKWLACTAATLCITPMTVGWIIYVVNSLAIYGSFVAVLITIPRSVDPGRINLLQVGWRGERM